MISKVTVQQFKRFKAPTSFEFLPAGITFLAGGNNSGKSTLLQALAVWEFARSVIEVNRGVTAIHAGATGHGVGVGADEFSPIALPDLKHLWSDVKGDSRYTLRIRCDWTLPGPPATARHLEIALALSNDRLFLKPTSSDVQAGEKVPKLAYLPPFAGIGPREERMLPAARRRWIGRGLAGAVLRNLLYDFWHQNCAQREKLKGGKSRISKKGLADLRKSDSWEQLLVVLEEVFKTGLTVAQFNELYNTTIEVMAWEGQLVNKKFRRKTGPKDLMVEGSGFLQWLSVYVLALNRDLDVLLLDEPDAHLHPALQGHLTHKLAQLARENSKQVLLATHSTTILSETKLDHVFRVEDRKYLTDERGRIALFVGLGSAYAPRLDQLKRTKRLFLHDGPSDLEILQAWAKTLAIPWPQNLVSWKYTKGREAREILFAELRAEIPGLKALSLQDRDNYDFAKTKVDLSFDDLPANVGGLRLRKWRRKNIENYLLHPKAIARAAGGAATEQQVREFLQDSHVIAIPADFHLSDCIQGLALVDGKDIITTNGQSISFMFNTNYKAIAEAMGADEIPDDPKTLLNELAEMCRL